MAAPLTDMEIGGALLSTRGNVEAAAQKLGCCRHTIYDRMKKNKAIGAARVAGRVMLIDAAEDKLFEAVTAGKGWAILFALKTVGKDRGYGESLRIGSEDGGPLALIRDMTDEEVLKRAREIIQ